MNNRNFTEIRIRKDDYFRLPAHLRRVDQGPMVLSHVNGKAAFVPAIIIH
ncbi:MAG TPA: hypothetical protein VF450_00655 [Noviherbaspirillum sp.]